LVDWSLLQGITYQSIRSEDHTGTTKVQLHTATFRDPQQQAAAAAAAATAAEATPSRIGRSSLTSLSQYIHGGGPAGGGAGDGSLAAAAEGSLVHSAGGSTTSSSLGQPVQCLTPRELGPSAAAAAAAEEAGIILAPWNPDQSWERDELVRIYAIHGALEKRHVVYEHIEVLVHPIRVHLTAALAAALQDYFNLKDEDSKLLPGAAGKGGAKPAGAGASCVCSVDSASVHMLVRRALSSAANTLSRNMCCVAAMAASGVDVLSCNAGELTVAKLLLCCAG
jgi:hypothetical protein